MTKTKKALEFRPNDFVVYPAHGVGRIVSIEEQEVAGLRLEMFVISFEKDKMTLRVPIAKANSVGMRPLSSADIVEKALETLKGRARVKRAMWSRRAQEYEQKINSGDLISIAEVVRDLHRSDDQREQSYSERQLYEAALERLTREVAAVERHRRGEGSSAGRRGARRPRRRLSRRFEFVPTGAPGRPRDRRGFRLSKLGTRCGSAPCQRGGRTPTNGTMTPAARLSAAIDILDAILAGEPAERALTRWARASRFAGSKDRAAIRDMVFDCLRQRRSLGYLGGGDTGRALVLAHAANDDGDVDALFTGTGFDPAPVTPRSGLRSPPTSDGAAGSAPRCARLHRG
jgi:CarD family transcriptional regulator